MLLSLSLGGLAFSVLQSLVAPALPAIARDLGVSAADASWVVTAYLLSASVLTPVLGRLGDMMGKRLVLLAVLGLLAAGTLLAALATDLATLVVARALQGAAGAIMPLSIGIVRDELPRERVSVVIGLLSAMVAGAAAVAGAFVLLTFAHEEAWQILAAGALTGAGIGLAFAAMPNAIIDAVPAGNTGEATSVNSIARTVGSSLGTAVIALVLSEGSGLAFSTGFAVCAGVGILAVLASFFLPARP